MKIVTVIGARPQFIKAAAISRNIRAFYSDLIQEVIVHTGQHYDQNMSELFFEELNIPKPDYHLDGFDPSRHKESFNKMVTEIKQIIQQESPDWVLVYGDTYSTLAGAQAAHETRTPLAHVEAGLRSFNPAMPEEQIRIQTDQWAQMLFAPTATAVENLKRERAESGRGVMDGPPPFFIISTGDIMYDNSLYFAELAQSQDQIFKDLKINSKRFVLATIHRNFNTDNPERLESILDALLMISKEMQVVLPLHPRTLNAIEDHFSEEKIAQIVETKNLIVSVPLSFLEMTLLEQRAQMIITDSGGVQKEAYFFKKPALILRAETEWIEIVEVGAAKLTDADPKVILDSFHHYLQSPPTYFPPLFGDGEAAKEILNALLEKKIKL
ncbi:MAG: UDP-N-acetylglucosamine 2-epimerase (non-hydrolyzing) [Bacteroidales bacterium]|jgi:UDP-GlcNAc3NAcA epimerase|nr:UDP-N-acetylglucosamine 2-epimerase (non-hydrolyzing) [Bacteroidales bacterium]HHT52439.1 UDP-N-acetylglucosamine 2-epimerase (non-hydrolyzing) [Bacteroidales bacterium]